ncbi:nucleotidyltransferase domain-containing protein [Nemorincola caseinilytica]|uniref:Nucleotidyltransferase domain-containing protein n=1 Tax=Nemorincola caseinilytica TaxID=2054315 RepID=A0ABP8NAS6_9BACT
MDKVIEQHLPAIKQLMLRYGVERAYLFGSAAKGTMTADSDVDLIIRFPDSMHYTTYSDNYFALADDLETLLKRPVDLVTEKTIRNPYLREVIDRSKMQVI